MGPTNKQRLAQEIVARAQRLGASAAGAARVAAVRRSPAHRDPGGVRWPSGLRTVVVLALRHDPDEPHLDWWEADRGTPGNRRLIDIQRRLAAWLEGRGHLVRNLPYHVEKGGLFLKDAAVLAGLGAIGRNNLLVSPAHGPHLRLRALLLDADTPAASLPDFSPCATCPAPCREACPRKAFARGSYDRRACTFQMQQDEALSEQAAAGVGGPVFSGIKYCRACELACPVGR